MAQRWGWSAYHSGGRPWSFTRYPHLGFFESAQIARNHLHDHLSRFDPASTEAVAAALLRTTPYTAGETVITCPPSYAWAVYPVPDGFSADQAASLNYRQNRHLRGILGRLDAKQNKITYNYSAVGAGSNPGCALGVLLVLGALVMVCALSAAAG